MAKKFLKGLVENVNEKDGTLSVAVATDTSVDRDGEIVDPAGLDLTNFLKNPVLLYAHDYRSDPIGKVISITRDGSRILFTPEFAIGISERAKQYFELCKQGFLNAFSIGFIPKEWSDRQNPDGSSNRIFTKSELLEISLVPVPANPNALILARTYKGFEGDKGFDADIIKEIETTAERIANGESIEPVEEVKDPEELSTKDYATKSEVSELKTLIEGIANDVAELKKVPADNGEKGSKAIEKVEELLSSGLFNREVLISIDKAVGKSLRDLNKA